MLSKSKLVAFRQCEKRLWLEIHKKELRQDSSATQMSFDIGNRIGDLARTLYDPLGSATFIDVSALGYAKAFEKTRQALQGQVPIFEAGFSHGGALAFADVMLPTQNGWRMIEVKSSAKVKDYQRDDVAIQRWIAEQSGVQIASVAIAYVDTSFVYGGDGNYAGLMKEQDLSAETALRREEIAQWVSAASLIAQQSQEPHREVGPHCKEPHACGFITYCGGTTAPVEFPVEWLPHSSAKLKNTLAERGITDMCEVDDRLLNQQQLRVKQLTLAGKEWLDSEVTTMLPQTDEPHYFLDFETIGLAVPLWKGTRPFQSLPFQFSLHALQRDGQVVTDGFLDLSGENPSRKFAEALIEQCNTQGPIFIYNQTMEGTKIRTLAEQFVDLAPALLAIHKRLFDLLPITRKHYYHPEMHGKFGIKSVLPVIAPELDYANLQGVQDGMMAQQAYIEAIASGTSEARKGQIYQQLSEYCGMDTWAMVLLWRKLSGKQFPG